MTNTMGDGPGATPPGWYPDNQGTMRWWDGKQWTEQTQALRSSSTAPAQGAIGAATVNAAGATKPWYQKKRWWLVAAVLVVIIGASIGGGSQTADDSPVASDTSDTSGGDREAPADTNTEAAAAPDAEAEPEAEPEPELTAAQENALESAENYLDMTAFSRSGLVKQLEFEGYEKKDATFAVNNLDANWNKEAAESAKNYLDMTPFSRDGLIQQLEFEGFTSKQAEYGVTQAGL